MGVVVVTWPFLNFAVRRDGERRAGSSATANAILVSVVVQCDRYRWLSVVFRALNISIVSYRNPSDELNQTYRPIVFRERKLTFTHVRYMLSPVRLSSVCCLSITLVRHTQSVEIFGNISTSLGTLAICWLSRKILRRSSPGNPSVGWVKCKRGSQI